MHLSVAGRHEEVDHGTLAVGFAGKAGRIVFRKKLEGAKGEWTAYGSYDHAGDRMQPSDLIPVSGTDLPAVLGNVLWDLVEALRLHG